VLQITKQTVDIVTRHRNALFLSGFSIGAFALGIDNRESVATESTKCANLSEIRERVIELYSINGRTGDSSREGSDRRVQRRWGGKERLGERKGGVYNSQSNFIRNVAQLDTLKSHNFDRDLRA
jgi:hypothetical protein